MLKLQIQREGQLWETVHLEEAPEVTVERPVYEADRLAWILRGAPPQAQVELISGDVTWLGPYPGHYIVPSNPGDLPEQEWIWPAERYFQDYAGLCPLRLYLRYPAAPAVSAQEQTWILRLTVLPAKITQAQYLRLQEELQGISQALLADLLSPTGQDTGSLKDQTWGLEARVNRLVAQERELERQLHRISRAPHHRRRPVYRVREGPPQAPVDDHTIRWLCQRNDLLSPAARPAPGTVNILGRPHEIAQSWQATRGRVYDVPEHRIIRGFLERLRETLKQLASNLQREVAEREADQVWKDRTAPGEQASWWEQEDAPRIRICRGLLRNVSHLDERLQKLLRQHEFLQVPPAPSSQRPLTPIFRERAPYRTVYRLMQEVEESPPTWDTGSFWRGMKDLPTLYEYWCVLKVLQVLGERWTSLDDVSVWLDTDRFTVRLKPNAPRRYRINEEWLCQVRYEPSYGPRAAFEAAYGRLTHGQAPLRPDLACEFFHIDRPGIPDFIYLFEVKYRKEEEAPRPEDIDVLRRYLHSIGRFADSRSLVRHAWLLYPGQRGEPWCDYPTFFHSSFSPQQPTVGAIPLVPGREPVALQRVLDRMLELDGMAGDKEGGEPSETGPEPAPFPKR